VHRGEQADAAEAEAAERLSQPAADIPLRGVEHEEADELRGMPAHGGGDRILVAGNARDDGSPGDAVAIELRRPAIRELIRASRIVPPEAMRYCNRAIGVGQIGKSPGEQLEEPRREEMAMNVAQPHGVDAIIIGLVSDTHGLLRNGVFTALAGVSRILHAGDVGGRPVLDALERIAPVQAVYGNVDPPDPPLQPQLLVHAGGLLIHVSHGHEFGSPTPAKLLDSYDADVIVFGHTHKALVHRDGPRLVVNPGAAGPRRFSVRPSVALLTIDSGRAEVEIVEIPV